MSESSERIPRRPAGHAPLSPVQRAMLGTNHVLDVVLHLPGPIDVDALRRALNNVVARHEILRTHYGDGTAQHVAAIGPAALRVTDVYHLPATGRWDEAMRLAAAEIATPFDLANGPVFRALLIALGTESPGHVLVLTMHRIAADDRSRTILLRELDELYGALSAGRRSTLKPLPIQFADYAYWLHRRLRPGRDLPETESLVGPLSDKAALLDEPSFTHLSADVINVAAELDDLADRIAVGLLAAGVAAGDTVGIVLPPGVDLTAATVGVLKCGAVDLVLEPGAPVSILDDVDIVITDGKTLVVSMARQLTVADLAVPCDGDQRAALNLVAPTNLAHPPVAVADTRSDVDDYPLSPLQTGMLFHTLFDPESTDYIVQFVCTLEGKLDVPLLRRAWEHVVDRHAVLRTTFAWDGLPHPVQRVHRYAPVQLRELDWRDIPVVDVPARLTSHLAAERVRGVDLERTPPRRFDLARLADRSYRLIWHGHHALLDDRSTQLVLDELWAIYRSLRDTGALPALPAPVRYIDSHDPADTTAYWQRLLGDLTSPTVLPILAPERGDHQGTSNQEVKALTGRVPVAQLRLLAEQRGITVGAIVHAAWGLLLRRYAQVDDVTFGTSGRVGNERAVGQLMNTLPIRLRVAADATVADLLRDVHEQLVALPACSLVDAQRQSQIPAGQRLFDTILSYETVPQPDPDSLTITQTWSQTGYPLVLNVRLHDDLRLRLDYQPGRLQPDAAERLMAHFRMLLDLLATQPDSRIADLAALPAVERRLVVHTFNDTAQRYPMDRCLHELFEAQVDRTPLAVAVRFRKESVTYRELDERANRVAHHLREMGVGAESLVGICVERGVDLAVAVLGVLKAGGAFVLDPSVDPAFVLTQAALMDRVAGQVVCLDDAGQCSSARVAGVVTPDNMASVSASHRGMVNHVSWLASNFPLAPGDKVLQLGTSVWEMFWPWSRGAAVVLSRPDGAREPQYVVHTLMRESITAVYLAPAMLRAILPLLEGQRLPLRWLFTGVLRPELLRECDKRCPQAEILSLYGANDMPATMWSCDASAGRVSIGRPIANTQVHVVDKAGQSVPIGVPGEALITGDGVRQTGDLVRWLSDGTLEFLGRLDEQVRIRGFRVDLADIESVLSAHPRLAHAIVVAREERLVAYVVSKGDKVPTTSELRAHLQSRLPDYMVPAAFVTLDWLPVHADGTADRTALPAPEVLSFVAPGTAIEQTLADVWSEVLRVPDVSVHDNFFDLGGDSILSIQVMVVARRAGIALTPRQIFANPTITDLAAAVDTPAEPIIVRAEQGTVAGDVPLTPIQRWFTTLDVPRDHYGQSVRLRWHEPFVPESLRRALDSVVTHHDALRSRLVRTRAGEWHQYIVAYEPADLLQTDSALSLTDGPLLRAALVKPDEVVITVHQLAIDATSWRILLDDLATAYRQYHAGEPCSLPAKTTSFRHWANRLATHATSADFALEATYWRQPRPLPHPFPVDHPDGRNTHESSATITRTLDESLLAHRDQINELLVTALAQTLSDHTGRSRVDIDIEGHGREPLFDDVDLTRTVGWFTSIHPLHITLPHSLDLARSTAIVREHLRHTPNHGIGHGIVQYLLPSPPNHLPAAVKFHYQSHTVQVELEMEGIRPYLLDVNAVVIDGEFQVHWTYSTNIHRSSTVESLADDFVARLTSLLAADQPAVAPERAFLDRLSPGAPSTLLRLGRHRIPGASIAVVADGVVVDAWGEGVADGVPVRPDTVFQVGSLSDHVTTLAVLRLAREGVLDLDERMRQLLAGDNFVVVEQLLSDAVGLPFPELMRELMFEPLGMRDSGYGPAFADSRADRIAMGPATGGLWTTAFDLAQVAVEIGRAHVGAGSVLNRWAVDQMLADGPRWYGHASRTAYSATGLDSGAGVVILTNGEAGHEFVTDLLVELGLGVRVSSTT
jgi:non-ribosomal peptide synthase protein (TIGR01720 family)